MPVASFTITKLAWVLENEPHLADRVARVMLPHDYLTWRLSGAHVTDRGDASGTGWYDPTDDRYNEALLARVAEPAEWIDRLPEVLGPTDAAGDISEEAAAALGLGDAVIVGPGTGDNMGAALGLGIGPGDAVMSLGTSGDRLRRVPRRHPRHVRRGRRLRRCGGPVPAARLHPQRDQGHRHGRDLARHRRSGPRRPRDGGDAAGGRAGARAVLRR